MRAQIINLVSDSNGNVIPRRCSENYIKKNDNVLYNYIANFDTTRSFKECVKMIIDNVDGLCVVCGSPTKMKGNGQFTATCSKECGYVNRVNGQQPNKVFIPKHELEYLYNNAKLQPSVIGELYDTSNVTVMARMAEYGIEKRSHAEQQILHANREVDVWNYNGFDREKANDIEFLKKENETKTIAQIACELGCSERTLHITFERNNTSCSKLHKRTYPEQLIEEFLTSLNIKYIVDDTTVLDKHELDVYIPSHNLAIEINGVFWHSEKFRDKKYHINKTVECESKGVQLLHFWDYEIVDKLSIVKSIIKAKLGMLTTKIYARKCTIREVSYNDTMQFITNNHIQGMSTSKINMGLYYNDNLVAIGTFMKPRFSKGTHDYELVRYCNVVDSVVVGGLSKIINSMSGTILSYANRRFSTGNAYSVCNFNIVGHTQPGFFYLHTKSGERISRYKDMSPLDEMKQRGWTRVWDCGNLIYEITVNKKEPIN